MRILDLFNVDSVAEAIMEAVGEMGYSPAEAIPGLIKAVEQLAEETSSPGQALDEAADLLSGLDIDGADAESLVEPDLDSDDDLEEVDEDANG